MQPQQAENCKDKKRKRDRTRPSAVEDKLTVKKLKSIVHAPVLQQRKRVRDEKGKQTTRVRVDVAEIIDWIKRDSREKARERIGMSDESDSENESPQKRRKLSTERSLREAINWRNVYKQHQS